MLYSAVPRSSQWPSIWTLAAGLALSHSALVFKTARACSESAALSKSKWMSAIGPVPAASPRLSASRLESLLPSALAGAGFADAVAFPLEALGFSEVQLAGGGLGGLPHAARNRTANNTEP